MDRQTDFTLRNAAGLLGRRLDFKMRLPHCGLIRNRYGVVLPAENSLRAHVRNELRLSLHQHWKEMMHRVRLGEHGQTLYALVANPRPVARRDLAPAGRPTR